MHDGALLKTLGTKDCFLILAGQADMIAIDPADLDTQDAGSDVTLTCTCPTSVCGSLQWHHNGMPLTDGEGGVVINEASVGADVTSLLTLESVSEDSKGKYRCSDPENPFDQAEVTLDVAAGGEPEEETGEAEGKGRKVIIGLYIH